MADALRAGYPDRIIAFNPGVEDRVRAYSIHEDFTCGEQNSFFDIPISRFIDGKQWHILSFLGANWAQPGTVKDKRQLTDYVYRVTAVGGVVSIDVVLYRDGDLDRSQLEVLKALRPGLEIKQREQDAWREGRAVPPRNKAWRKPALLLNAEGKYRLGPSVGEAQYGAFLGVDGDPATAAQAGGEWAWTYEVDLLGEEKVSRVIISFGPVMPRSLKSRRPKIVTPGRHWASFEIRRAGGWKSDQKVPSTLGFCGSGPSNQTGQASRAGKCQSLKSRFMKNNNGAPALHHFTTLRWTSNPWLSD